MKKIFFLVFILSSFIGFGQSGLYLRSDSVFIMKGSSPYILSGNNELNLFNGTRTKNGAFLQNYNNGRTRFSYAVDSVWGIGDTMYFRRGDSTVKIAVSTSGVGGVQWGNITGTLSAQTDLQTALNAKQNTITLGTTSQYFKGNLTLGTFSNDVIAVGDPRYSTLGHTHIFNHITDGVSAVHSLFSATAPLNYNSATGNFSISGTSVQDGLISGGVVTWSGTGLVFNVTPASYVISGSQYSAPASNITLDAADGSFGRYDAIVVNISGAVSKITGTASASPVFPQADPANELVLTYVFVDAGATTPTLISNVTIYDENIEWTTTSSGGATANFASTAQAQSGTKSIAATWSGTSNLIFTNGAALVSNNYSTLSFYIRLTNTMANNVNVSAQFYNGSTQVSNGVTSTFSKLTTGSWQLVSFNISQFNFTSSNFNSVRLVLTGSNTLNTVYFDNIKLQAGTTPPPPSNTGLQSAYTKVTDGSNLATSLGSDQLKFRVDNTLSVLVGNNDATHGDNVLFKVDTTKIATINYVDNAINAVALDLQAVTDIGYITTNPIFSSNAIVSESQFQARADAGFRVVNPSTFSTRVQLGMVSDKGFLYVGNSTVGATVNADDLTSNRAVKFPDQAGTLLVGATPTASVDNTVTHKIKVNIGGTDYYIMVTTSGL